MRIERAVFFSTWDIFLSGGNCSCPRNLKSSSPSPNSSFRKKYQGDVMVLLGFPWQCLAGFTSRLNLWKCSIPNRGSPNNNNHPSFGFQQLLTSSSSSGYQNNPAEKKVNMTLPTLQMKRWKCRDMERLNKNSHYLYPHASALRVSSF